MKIRIIEDMFDIDADNKWLMAIENVGTREFLLEEIDLFWNGGDCTLLDKREFNLALSVARPSDEEVHGEEIEIEDMEGLKIFKSDESHRNGLTSYIDYDSISFLPVGLGKTEIEMHSVMEPGSILFIGGNSQANGKLSLVIKGELIEEMEEDVID